MKGIPIVTPGFLEWIGTIHFDTESWVTQSLKIQLQWFITLLVALVLIATSFEKFFNLAIDFSDIHAGCLQHSCTSSLSVCFSGVILDCLVIDHLVCHSPDLLSVCGFQFLFPDPLHWILNRTKKTFTCMLLFVSHEVYKTQVYKKFLEMIHPCISA